MAFTDFNLGTTLGDHTGDDGRSILIKIKAMLQELYAGGSGGGNLPGYATAVVTAASTNNYTSGGAFPTSTSRLDINPTTNDVTFTGLVAGSDGQQMLIRNIGSTYNLNLNIEDTGSSAANRFNGEGTALQIPPSGNTMATYYLLPNPRWTVG